MSSEYIIVNPHILGNIKTTYVADNPLDVATIFWNNLNEYTTNYIPQFFFTIKQINTNDLFHFKINETINNDKRSKYIIKQIYLDFPEFTIKNLVNTANTYSGLNTFNIGGDRKRYKNLNDPNDSNDSSSDDSDSDNDNNKFKKFFNIKKYQPIAVWVYNPAVYRSDVIFQPTFLPNTIPYMQLCFDI